MKKWLIKIIAYLAGKAIQKSKISLDERKYKKAFRYLNWSEMLGNLVGSPALSNPIDTTQRLELNFLTHNYEYVLKNIEIPINAIEKTKIYWSEADRRYMKVHNYNFILLIYILLNDEDKILEWYKIFNDITVDGARQELIDSYPPYNKEELQKLFESDEYYAKNYSEELINNVYKLSEHIWGR